MSKIPKGLTDKDMMQNYVEEAARCGVDLIMITGQNSAREMP